jgi:hypothetical protein
MKFPASTVREMKPWVKERAYALRPVAWEMAAARFELCHELPGKAE